MFNVNDIVFVRPPFDHTFSGSYPILEIIEQNDPMETVCVLSEIGAFATKYLKANI